jgi:HEAT repeat protein
MSENQAAKPASPASDSGPQSEPEQIGRRLGIARPLILLVVCGGALLWTARLVWESRHPAVAAARGLTAATPSDRLTAVRDLTAAGITDNAIAIPRLTPALRDQDAGVRIAAVESMGLLITHAIKGRVNENESRAAVVDLLASLKDPEANVRIAAINVLANIRTAAPAVPRQAPKKAEVASAPMVEPKVMIAAMTGLLADPDATVRTAALRGLWEASATDPAAGLAPSTLSLKDEDAGVRSAAANAVGQLIGHAVKNRSAEDQARAAAADLLAALKDPQANVRQAAIQALMTVSTTSPGGSRPQSNQDAKASAPPIDAGTLAADFTESLGDREPTVRSAAIRALGRLKPAVIPATAVPLLVSALKNGESDVRYEDDQYEIISLLSKLGSKADTAIPAFIAALKAPADTDRGKTTGPGAVLANTFTGPAYVAADALGAIAPRSSFASKAVTALAEVVASGPSGRRPVAASALEQFGAEAGPAVPALVKMLRDTAPPDARSDYGSSAARALGKIAPGTPSAALAVPALTEALKSKSAETREAATNALERFNPRERQGNP